MMIAPRSNSGDDQPVDAAFSLTSATAEFFRPGGRMERACDGTEFAFEERPQQLAMAEAVARAIDQQQHLVVEAGTGVGKSFAYLVPAILSAVHHQTRVVVSTYTISLQEQLLHKDVPFLLRHLGVPFRAILVKGRSNYLCLRRLDRARKMSGDLFPRDVETEVEAIRAWADTTADGSLQDLTRQPSADAWNAVCCEPGNCLWQQCPEFKPCFLMSARRQMHEADVLIVNHHLFFSDLALRAKGAAFLPDYGIAILDEAHEVEDVATEHLGLRISQFALEHWLHRLYHPDTGKGLIAALKDSHGAHLVTGLYRDVENFCEALRKWADLKGEATQRVVESPQPFPPNLQEGMGGVCARLRELVEKTEDPEVTAELASLEMHGLELKDGLRAFIEQSLPDQVYWVEEEGRRRKYMTVYSAPIEVARDIRRTLFETLDCVVMTSATLAVAGSMEFFQKRLGAESADPLQVGSPFDFARQMRIHIPKNLPDPNDSERFLEAASAAIEHYVGYSQGRALVLFTSAQFMRAAAERLRAPLESLDLRLIVQGEEYSRHAMLEELRNRPSTVLFGLDSFWMGVDVRGEALSNVIITRLPFTVPDLPVVKARMDRIRAQGGDPFRDYSLPEAILKFRQGVGRLIRTATDEGMVVILDGRILRKWYGKLFLRSLPECPIRIDDLESGEYETLE